MTLKISMVLFLKPGLINLGIVKGMVLLCKQGDAG